MFWCDDMNIIGTSIKIIVIFEGVVFGYVYILKYKVYMFQRKLYGLLQNSILLYVLQLSMKICVCKLPMKYFVGNLPTKYFVGHLHTQFFIVYLQKLS